MPVSQINADGSVKIYSKTTGQVLDVKPEDLPKYNPALVGEYQQKLQQQQAVASAAASIQKGAIATSDVPQDIRVQVGSALAKQGYDPEAVKKKQKLSDQEDAARGLVQSTLQNYLNIPDKEKEGLGYKASLPFLNKFMAPTATEYEAGLKGEAPALAKIFGGDGSGLRITQAEINSWLPYFPSVHKTGQQNAADVQKLNTIIEGRFGKGNGLDPEYLKQYGVTGKGQAPQQPEQPGLPENAGSDAKSILNNLLNMPKNAIEIGQKARSGDKQAIQQLQDMTSPGGIAKTLVKGGVQEVNDLTGHPLEGGDVVGRILNRAYQKPVTTALDVLPFLGGAKKMLPTKGIEVSNPLSGVLGKTGDNMVNSARNIDVGPSVYGAQKEAAINQTMNDLGIHGNAAKQYTQLKPMIDQLGDAVQMKLQQTPKQVPVDQVKNDFMGNLHDEILSKTLNTKTAQSEINGLLNDVYGSKLGQTISTPELFSLKQKLNGIYGRIQDKLDRGIGLTDREQVIRVARKTVDDIITANHPDVKEMTTKQSHLYDAADSLYKSRKAKGPSIEAFGTRIGLPGNVAQSAQDMLGNILRGK